MRWQYQALGVALAATLVGCGPRDDTARDSGSAANPSETTPGMTGSTGGTDTTSVGGTAGATVGTDTAAGGGMTADTGKAHKGGHDTAKTKPDTGP